MNTLNFGRDHLSIGSVTSRHDTRSIRPRPPAAFSHADQIPIIHWKERSVYPCRKHTNTCGEKGIWNSSYDRYTGPWSIVLSRFIFISENRRPAMMTRRIPMLLSLLPLWWTLQLIVRS